MPLLHLIDPEKVRETAIIALSDHVASILPMMLIVAAVMSQFSAAVADTLWAGGLLQEKSRNRVIPGNPVY